MRYLACLLTIAVLFSGAVFAQENWAERFPSKMTPQLEKALTELKPGGTLDLYLVMKDRVSFVDLVKSVEGVRVSERHKIVTKVLRSYANKSQEKVRSLLAGKKTRVLWLCNAIRFDGDQSDIDRLLPLDEVGYLGVNLEFPEETYQDATPGSRNATLPFYDGFESGSFGPDWTTATTGTGRIQITTAEGPIGKYHVTMDSSVSNSYGTCTMTLKLDLSGVTNCFLDFMFKEFSDELDPEDHVSLSDNGVTFHPVRPLSGGSSYELITIDIDKEAAKAGITLSKNFYIRFSWKDNYPIDTDGFAFDEINVKQGDPPPIPPEPNIVKLQAPLCWGVGVKGKGALILNLDSGVDYTHPDLVNQIWANPGEVPFGNNGIDDDGNGYIDDFNGWDFDNDDNDPYPSSSHGTNTAGIVCGDGTAGSQTGMAPEATMAIARLGGMADYMEAQQYAVLIGARVITSSHSYKWGIHDPDYHMFRTNCENELIAGITHSQSLGNQGDQLSSFPIPFNISSPGNSPGPWIHPDQVKGGVTSIMGCAGVRLDESLYTPSGQGPSAWEDIKIYDPSYPYPQKTEYWDYPYGGFGGGLPGLLKPDMCTYTEVKTTTNGGGYTSSFGGTSAATPHLGGALCLLISGNPHASPRKLSQALQETAEDKGPVGKDSRYGAGKVQVYDALLRVIHNVEFSNHMPSIGDTVDLEISGTPGRAFGFFYSATKGSILIPGVGVLELGMPFTFLLASMMPGPGVLTFPVNIPNHPSYIGQKFYMQGIMDDTAGATGEYLFSLVENLEIQP